MAERYLRFDRAVLTGLLPPGRGLHRGPGRGAPRRGGPRGPHPAARAPRAPAHQRRAHAHRPLALGHWRRSSRRRCPRERASWCARSTASRCSRCARCSLEGCATRRPPHNGLTTLLGRSLTRGTRTRDAEEITQLMDAYAGSLAGVGGRNSVGVRGEFLSRHFEPAFRLFADCVVEPSFPEAEVARERRLLLQDILTREDKPSGLAFDLFSKTLYRAHPYRLPTLGEHGVGGGAGARGAARLPRGVHGSLAAHAVRGGRREGGRGDGAGAGVLRQAARPARSRRRWCRWIRLRRRRSRRSGCWRAPSHTWCTGSWACG